MDEVPAEGAAVLERTRGSSMITRELFWGAILALPLAACAEHVAVGQAPPAPAVVPSAPPATKTERESCEAAISAAEAGAALAGAPRFEERRHQILGRAKAEPVLFLTAPAQEPASKEIENYRKVLRDSPNAGYSLYGIWRTIKNRPEVVRALVLQQGYLYSDDPQLAPALANLIELHNLYRVPELHILRGSEVLRAVKGKSFFYVYADGPEKGKRARVLLLDRVAPRREELFPALHVDVRKLAHQRGFDGMRVSRITDSHVIAQLRYSGVWVPALLEHSRGAPAGAPSPKRGGSVELACEVVRPELEAVVKHHRRRVRERRAAFDHLRQAIVHSAEEALPFDEPKTEEGQQDGNLRPAWIWAYNHGWESYTFNDDGYRVFDASGRPLIPQVCIDFITDTFERASGTWWGPRSGERVRTEGGVDFDKLDIENRRSVEVFVRYAWRHPARFDVYDLKGSERIAFYQRDAFFDHLLEHRDRYQPGDVISIHGLRSDGEMHYHSFFIYEADPVSGMPTILAGNAGKPRIRTWENVMRAAPRRSIKSRVRPRLEWLEQLLESRQKSPEASAEVNGAPPPRLTSAPI